MILKVHHGIKEVYVKRRVAHWMRIKSEQKTGPDWSRPKFTGKMPGRLYLGLKCPRILIHLQVTLLYFEPQGVKHICTIFEKGHSQFSFWNIFRITSF